jgi:hypothetical protein
MSEVVHGATAQILPTSLLAGWFLFCWDSKPIVLTKTTLLKDGARSGCLPNPWRKASGPCSALGFNNEPEAEEIYLA